LKNISSKNELLNASFWSTFDTLGAIFIKFAFSILISRMLLPSEIGVVVLTYILIDILQLFSSLGFQSALINHENISKTDRDSVFYLNISISLFLSCLIFLCSKHISIFFGNHLLENILKILCIVPIINAFNITHVAHFYRNMDHKIVALANSTAILVSCSISLVLAYLNFSLQSLIFSSLLWIASPFYPSMNFSFNSIKKLSKYSLSLFSAGLINKVFDNIYYVVIGKFYSPSILGLYSRANSLSTFISQNIAVIFTKVSFPAISKIKTEREKVKQLSLNMLSYTALAVWPLMAFISAASDNLIPFLLTEKWSGCIEFLKLLCLWGAIQAINKINTNLLQASGCSSLILKIEILHKTFIIGVLLFTISLGITHIIIGQVFCSSILFLVLAISNFKVSKIGYLEQLKIYYPYFLLSFIVYIATKSILIPVELTYSWNFLLQLSAYVFTYIAFLFLFKKEILSFFYSRFTDFKNNF